MNQNFGGSEHTIACSGVANKIYIVEDEKTTLRN